MYRMTSRAFIFLETLDCLDHEEEEDSVSKYLRLIEEAKREVHLPVIASINCVSTQKWTNFSKEIESAVADALGLNLFILPTDFDRSVEENEKLYF